MVLLRPAAGIATSTSESLPFQYHVKTMFDIICSDCFSLFFASLQLFTLSLCLLAPHVLTLFDFSSASHSLWFSSASYSLRFSSAAHSAFSLLLALFADLASSASRSLCFSSASRSLCFSSASCSLCFFSLAKRLFFSFYFLLLCHKVSEVFSGLLQGASMI